MDYPIFSKRATLYFCRKELMDDIKNNAGIEGDTMKRDNAHDKHMVYDIAEKGNVERVTRVLDLAFNLCVDDMCYPYAKKEIKRQTSRDNEYEVEDEYIMHLRLPDNFSDTSVTLLEKLIHEYMVNSVMYDWMGLTKPESVPFWERKLEDAKAEIIGVLTRRTRCLTRKMNPF